MTKTLILMRHAKSAWDDPLLDDHERSLNDRGRRSADAVGTWLSAQRHLPDTVLSSTARRTRETWEGLAPHLPAPERVIWTRDLYLASSMRLLKVLQRSEGRTILLLGHNEGIGEAASLLVRTPPKHPRFLQYPTAAVTVMRFDIDDWAAAIWGAGEVVDFIVPRDLGVA
ncbi:SixA phosphatase family protein [Anianabacter salinae]|uniref:SixA phosphatase family protein n=1 Tax=Anianabacter salinae TaxID=2851023 RepID=UPI00225E6875|nr:histidine phosphatase family protein [Anianabacter salinae]MBV0913114.1 histidine phosphatase family protein [Anianabacter salinae]